MKLQGLLFDAGAITPARCDEMFRLMLRCFANVTREAFTRDLSEKRWVILLLNPNTQELCGFSTQMLITLPVDGAATTAHGRPSHAAAAASAPTPSRRSIAFTNLSMSTPCPGVNEPGSTS